jgi:hypothetical protein
MNLGRRSRNQSVVLTKERSWSYRGWLFGQTTLQERPLHSFLQRFADRVSGVLNGFDRLRFRGTKRLLMPVGGLLNFLWQAPVLLKDFKDYACSTTATLGAAVDRAAAQAGGPVLYLNSATSKEALARSVAARDGITEGLIAVFSAVESCYSYSVHPNRHSKQLELRGGTKKCLHY